MVTSDDAARTPPADVTRDDVVADLARRTFGPDYAMFGYPLPQGAAS